MLFVKEMFFVSSAPSESRITDSALLSDESLEDSGFRVMEEPVTPDLPQFFETCLIRGGLYVLVF